MPFSKKVIAVDFDGTLCVHEYPGIGAPLQDVIDDLLYEQEKGAKIILWTCRGGEDLDKALAWCKEQGITFDAINDDLPEIKESPFGKTKSTKIYADEYWDDRAIEIKESIVKVFKSIT